MAKTPADPDAARLPIPTWQYDFAEWLARQTVKNIMQEPKWPEQLEKASELCGQVVAPSRLRPIKRQQEYQEYYQKCLLSVFEKTEQTMLRRMKALADRCPLDMEWALDKAINVTDYKATADIAGRIMDRAHPIKGEKAAATNITIHLSDKQAADWDLDAPVVEVEVLDDGIPEN